MFVLTGNTGKFTEIQLIFPEAVQMDVDLPEIQSLDPQEIIEFKLMEASQIKEGAFMVEDTSLFCDGLNGLPGPLIKWFLKKLSLEQIVEKVGENSSAQAVTTVGYRTETGDMIYATGKVAGTIVSPRGDQGFGWDMIFQPEGSDKTFGEMDRVEKTQYSMRRIALEKLKGLLQ